MTKIAFCLWILSVSTFADPLPRFATDDGGTVTVKIEEKKPAPRIAIDHGTAASPSPKAEEKSDSSRPAAKADPDAPSAAEEEFVPNPFAVVLSSKERAVIRELNQERHRKGMKMVKPAPDLMKSSRNYATYMRDANWFNHQQNLPGHGSVSENIAAGKDDPARTMNQWWTSTAGHRENMMNPVYEYIGIGYAPGGKNPKIQGYWCQNFSSQP